MQTVINAKTLRNDLAAIMERVRHGERFTVLYRSRPVCQIIPLDQLEAQSQDLEHDPLYQAEAVGASTDGQSAADHDAILYPDKD